MAENSIAVLNVGSQTITLAQFESGKKGLVMKKFATASVLADPANEAVRQAQVKVAIENLIEQIGVKKLEVLYSVSGQSVFTRFVKLPALGDDNIDQLVTFEAQQHIPFPIQEVAWDWELMDSSGAEKEVAIVAIKKDALNDLDKSILDAGLISKNVESSPISLTNSFFYNYPELKDESTLIIDAGAKTTNLIYVQGKRVFIRSVNVSGVSVTSAISKEYKVDYAEAEKFKVEAGRVAISGAYLQEWDESTGALATVISNVISRLPSEISRTSNFFRSQHGGTAPTRIILAGAASSLPYFKEYIEEKLSLPAEYFNPFKNVATGGDINPEQIAPIAHTLGELVGLSLKGVGKNTLSIDLVSNSVEDRREESRKKPYYLGALGAFVIGAAVWTGSQYHFASVAEQKLQEINIKKGGLERYASSLQKLGNTRRSLDAVAIEYSTLVENRYRSLERLEELRKAFSSEIVWLEEIDELVDFDPTANKDKRKVNPYVSDGFETTAYGSSAIKSVASERGKKTTAGPKVNAVRVKGYWRSNPVGQNVVYDILNTIKDDENSIFTFELNGKTIDESGLLEIKSTIPEGEFKAPFTMILPLSQPNVISK